MKNIIIFLYQGRIYKKDYNDFPILPKRNMKKFLRIDMKDRSKYDKFYMINF